MFIEADGTIQGEGWWIYSLSALQNGRGQRLIDTRNANPYAVPDSENRWQLDGKVGLPGLISGLRQLVRTGMTTYRSLEQGVHEHTIDHRLLGPLSYCWSTAGEPSFSLSARGRPIFTACPASRQKVSVRWHFDDPLKAKVERILSCPTGRLVRPEEVVDGGITVSRQAEGEGWLSLLSDLSLGNAAEIMAARNTNLFLLPDEQHDYYLLSTRAGHDGFIDLFRHIARARQSSHTDRGNGVHEYAFEHRSLGHVCWRHWFDPGPWFELEINGKTLIRSRKPKDSWEVRWLVDVPRRAEVELILSCPSGQQHFSEWKGI
jgi:hypothetical protein